MGDVKSPEQKAADLLANQAVDKAAKEKADKEAKEAEEVKAAKEKADKEAADNEPPESEEDKAILEDIKKEKEVKAFNDYQKFAEYHFLMWDGLKFERKRIKKEALEHYDKLEKTFKASKGHKPKKSNTVVIGLGVTNARIVEGYGVPDSLYQIFVDAGKAEKYF